MLALAVDTAADLGSLALFKNSQYVDQASWNKTSSHSELISLNLKQLLLKNSLNVEDLSCLAVNIGPGSFTGIRVGVNFVRALGYSLHIPIYSCNSLRLIAGQALQLKLESFYVLHYAFRDLFYFSRYRIDGHILHELTDPIAITAQKFVESLSTQTLVLGNGPQYLKHYCNLAAIDLILTPSSTVRAYSQAKDFQYTSFLGESPGRLTSWIHTIPLYVRASEAEEKLKLGLIKSQF